jgi:hypothetical protein
MKRSLEVLAHQHTRTDSTTGIPKFTLRVDYMPAKHFCKHLFLSRLLYQPIVVYKRALSPRSGHEPMKAKI